MVWNRRSATRYQRRTAGRHVREGVFWTLTRGELRKTKLNHRSWCRSCQPRDVVWSYHIRNVPVLSTIEMSPGCGFTLPRTRRVSSWAQSRVARVDSELGERGVVSGIRDVGEGAAPLPSLSDLEAACSSRNAHMRPTGSPSLLRAAKGLGFALPRLACQGAPAG